MDSLSCNKHVFALPCVEFQVFPAVIDDTESMLRNSTQYFFDELNSVDSKTFWKTVRFLNNQQS